MGDHRAGDLLRRDRYLLELLDVVQPDEVDLRLLYVGNAALDRRIEGATLGADQVAAGADHEVGVQLRFRRHGRPELADGLILRDAFSPGRRSGTLRELLVFDVDAAGPG